MRLVYAKKLVLMNEVKKRFENDNNIWYKCRQYEVRYNKLKKSYTCNCKWFSITQEDCSHILAVKMIRGEING